MLRMLRMWANRDPSKFMVPSDETSLASPNEV